MTTGVTQTTVIIIGAGPSGLATAACLNQLSIPYILLEKEGCIASLFTNKAYNRLHLHLHKTFCQLPHLPFPQTYPNYVSRTQFLNYLNTYATHFNINPVFNNVVTLARYDEGAKKWKVETEVVGDGYKRLYEGMFLVVASGESSEAFVPEIDGLSEFKGEVIHSTEYKSGEGFEKKKVLVVGSGNSGMEIAYDLCSFGAQTSIVVRSPMHIVSRWSTNLGLTLLKFISLDLVDSLLVWVNNIAYGDLTKYGIQRPKELGPFAGKVRDGKYPIIDMGTCQKIKSGEIQVLPALKSIKGGDEAVFENGKCYQFDAIVFATGFKRSTHLWLQGDDLLDKDGLPKPMYPNHWKGENGLYCVGLARNGLYGAAIDAINIAQQIHKLMLI